MYRKQLLLALLVIFGHVILPTAIILFKYWDKIFTREMSDPVGTINNAIDMNNMRISALVCIAIAAVLLAFSIPLLLKRIPPNLFYGMRFSSSFTSRKNWYEINAYGGKIAFVWIAPLIVLGIVGLVLDSNLTKMYVVAMPIMTALLIFGWIIHTYVKARQIARASGNNSSQPINSKTLLSR